MTWPSPLLECTSKFLLIGNGVCVFCSNLNQQKAAMQRKHFLTGLVSTGFLALPFAIRAGSEPGPDQLDKALVQEFVGICHSDMDKAIALLNDFPSLLNAAHDWGGGDFETGLGAASHVGYKELARFLIDKGAQANIFTACLFGMNDVVRAMYEAFPQILNARGPHGFSLLHHAEKGGEEALEVREFLLSRGASTLKFDLTAGQ